MNKACGTLWQVVVQLLNRIDGFGQVLKSQKLFSAAFMGVLRRLPCTQPGKQGWRNQG